METRTKIKAVARATEINGMFQTVLKPTAVLNMDNIVERWAAYAKIALGQARWQIMAMEDFIIDQLAQGNQLDFGLVSFYPRLSGGLSSRDADPEADGLFVRGAVKARRALMNGLKEKLMAENAAKPSHVRIYSVLNRDRNRADVVSVGDTLSIVGANIPIDATQDDEGVWLERRTHVTNRNRPWVKVARGRVVQSDMALTVVVFDEPVPPRKYSLTVYTRCGQGADFQLLHCRREVRAV